MSTTTIEGPAGAIEILAEGFDRPFRGVAIVCHPHPLHGGTMNNKVVHFVARTMRELGLATVRFNFRGVGASEGSFDHGAGETHDLLAVTDWLRSRHPGVPLWLAGFSFGAYVALRGVTQRDFSRLVTIAPAVHLYDFSEIELPRVPWLLIQGDADEVVPVEEVRKWIRSLPKRPRAIYLKGVSHFFHGHLTLLRDVLKAALKEAAEALPPYP